MSDPQSEPEIVVDEVVTVDEIVVDGEVVEVITDDVTTVQVVVDGEVIEVVTDEITTDEVISDGELVEAVSHETVTDVVLDDGEIVDAFVDDESVEVDFASDDHGASEQGSWARPASTGDPRVDDALLLLDGLDSMPTSEHVVIVEDVHRRLQDALGDPAPETRP